MCAQFVCQHETTNEADPLLIVSYYFNDKLHLKKKKKNRIIVSSKSFVCLTVEAICNVTWMI